jgi:DNA uptake protein ComE-like DNA-binding protein
MYGATNVEPLEDTGVDDGTTTGNTRMDQALENLAEGVVEAAFSGEGTTTTRAGMDLTQPATTNIESLYELVDAEVDADIDGVTETLISPWNSSSGDLLTSLPELFQNFSTSSVEYIDGRININQARYETMLGIPGMTEELAQLIISQRPIDEAGQPLPQMAEMQATTGWIYMQSLADLVTMRRLDRYITSRGDVYSVQVLGHYDVGGPISRVEATIDSTETPAKVIFQRDISHLGPGYRVSELLGSQ